jgi:hypothetical protein
MSLAVETGRPPVGQPPRAITEGEHYLLEPNAIEVPSAEQPWSPLEELSKGLLDWLESADLRNPEHLRAAILTTEGATLTHPTTPLADDESAHVVARMLRLLRSTYALLHDAANKGR